MPSPEKDQLAAEAMECWVDFSRAFPRTAEISDPAVQSFLGGYEALRRADEVESSDSPACR